MGASVVAKLLPSMAIVLPILENCDWLVPMMLANFASWVAAVSASRSVEALLRSIMTRANSSMCSVAIPSCPPVAMTALISSVDVAISVDILLEASASLLKSSSVPFTVFRTYANEDSKSILALTAVVPSATIGVVMCVVSVFPALVMALDRVPHFFEKFVSAVPACVHADFIR